MPRTTNFESTYIDETRLGEIIDHCGLAARDIAAASGMAVPTFAKNRHGVSRNTTVGNVAQIANTLGYELRLTLSPRGEHNPEQGTPTLPLRISPDATQPQSILHPLIIGPGQAFGPYGRIVAMPTLLHAAVAEFLVPNESPKVAAMTDPMRVFATKIRYQFKGPGYVPVSWAAVLEAQYHWYLSQGDRADEFAQALIASANRPIVILAPKPNHLAWHEIARCGVCREGGNVAGRVLESVREGLV